MNGSWIEKIEFDGKKYWDIDFVEPAKVIPFENVLDSDCRFREDLVALS